MSLYLIKHEDMLGRGGIAPQVLNLRTRYKCVVSFRPTPLHRRGEPRTCTDVMIGTKISALPGIESR